MGSSIVSSGTWAQKLPETLRQELDLLKHLSLGRVAHQHTIALKSPTII